jgi:competence protein ComEC
MKKLFFLFSTALMFLTVLVIFAFYRFNDSKLHVVFCDVGQGDAIFIRTARQVDILVDGGPDDKVLDCLSRHMPFWDRSLDFVVMTHPDADHSAGLIDVIERYRVGVFYTESVPGKTDVFKRLEAILAEKKLSAKYLHSGNKLKDGFGFQIDILWPSLSAISKVDQNKTNQSLNELSVIQLVSYGSFNALLTGDADYKIMDEISSEASSIKILKVPHHGSKTGMSDHFLAISYPELAVISVGKGNRYGHPAKISLDLLKKT